MSNLIIKSKENINAADMLITNSKYNACIHNCYFAVLQVILSVSKNNGYKENNSGEGSHNRLIKFFENYLICINGIDRISVKKTLWSIKELKKHRVLADYKE